MITFYATEKLRNCTLRNYEAGGINQSLHWETQEYTYNKVSQSIYKPNLWNIIFNLRVIGFLNIIAMAFLFIFCTFFMDIMLFGYIRCSFISMFIMLFDDAKYTNTKKFDEEINKLYTRVKDALPIEKAAFSKVLEADILDLPHLNYSIQLFRLIALVISLIAIFVLFYINSRFIKDNYEVELQRIMNSCYLSSDIELDKFYIIMNKVCTYSYNIGYLIFGILPIIALCVIWSYTFSSYISSPHSEKTVLSYFNYRKMLKDIFSIKKFNIFRLFIGVLAKNRIEDIEAKKIFRDEIKAMQGNYIGVETSIIFSSEIINYYKYYLIVLCSMYIFIFILVNYLCSRFIVGKINFVEKQYEYFDNIIQSYETFNSINIASQIIKKVEETRNDKEFWKSLKIINLIYYFLLVGSLCTIILMFVLANHKVVLKDILSYMFNNITLLAMIISLFIFQNRMFSSYENIEPYMKDFYNLRFYNNKGNRLYSSKKVVPRSIMMNNANVGHNISLMFVEHFDIQLGSIVRLLGPSGGGKTTLINTILNAIPRLSGDVSVAINNGATISIDNIAKFELYKNIGYCPQAFQITNMKLRDLILNYANINEKQGLWLLNFVCMDKWFKSLPQGWDTFLVDLSRLSGGERNLLKLAIELAKLVREKKKTNYANIKLTSEEEINIRDRVEFCHDNDGLNTKRRDEYHLEGILFLDETLDNVENVVRQKIMRRLEPYILRKKLCLIIVTHNDFLLMKNDYYNFYIGNGTCFFKSYHYAELDI